MRDSLSNMVKLLNEKKNRITNYLNKYARRGRRMLLFISTK